MLALAYLLVRGIRITAKANISLVVITILVLLVVIVIGASELDSGNWSPFSPFGTSGIIGGAALVFFAFSRRRSEPRTRVTGRRRASRS